MLLSSSQPRWSTGKHSAWSLRPSWSDDIVVKIWKSRQASRETSGLKTGEVVWRLDDCLHQDLNSREKKAWNISLLRRQGESQFTIYCQGLFHARRRDGTQKYPSSQGRNSSSLWSCFSQGEGLLPHLLSEVIMFKQQFGLQRSERS